MPIRDAGTTTAKPPRPSRRGRCPVFHATLDTGHWTLPRSGFTLIELLVVIAVIAVLASLLMTAAFRAMDVGRKTQCRNNLNQIGKGFYLYVHKYTQWMPPIGYPQSRRADGHFPWWYDSIVAEVQHPKIVVCPAKPQTRLGYGYNVRFADPIGDKHLWNQTYPINIVKQASATIAFGDTGNVYNWDTHPPELWEEDNRMPVDAKLRFPYRDNDSLWTSLCGRLMPRHVAMANCLMFDGGVQSHRVEDVLGHKYGEGGCLFDNQ
ncbi:MAG: type II secretion system protein [Planctomycetota bacterium]